METVAWIDPLGNLTALNVEGSLGRFMPPVSLTESPIPLLAGGRLRQARNTSRPITLQTYILGDNPTALRVQERQLATAFDTTNRGPGRLRNTSDDGTMREVVCYYESGFGGEDFPGELASYKHRRYQLVFRCFDPYWYEVAQSSKAWPIGASTANFFPFFPLILGASDVQGTTTLTIPGDVAVWPRWEITGPGTTITLSSLNQAESIVWNGTLVGGDKLVIDTSPQAGTVILNGDTDVFDQLTEYGFFPLLPGLNDLTVSMVGTDDNSNIAVFWRNGYLTP